MNTVAAIALLTPIFLTRAAPPALTPALPPAVAQAQAQRPAAGAADPTAPQNGPHFVVVEELSGETSRKALDGFETSDPRQMGAWILRFENPLARPAAGDDVADVRLAHGERLIGRVRRGEGETLDIDVAPLVHVRATLENIQSMRFAGRIPAGWNQPLEPAREGDRLYRRKSTGKNVSVERIEGGVESFGDDGLVFHDERVGSLPVRWEDVVALFVESAPVRHAAPAEGAVAVVVDLVDASRIAGTLVRLDRRGLTLKRWQGETLLLPLSVLSLVVVDDERMTFLSEMEPVSAAPATPFGDDLGMRWPHVVDASVTGTPLVVGGKTFARGIGVHAPSRIVWKLDGGYAGLRGLCGVDDSVLRLAARGSVKFRVVVDGAARFETRTMVGGEAPVAVVLDPPGLKGAQELVLEVDVAEDSFVADRADWLQMVLVRE